MVWVVLKLNRPDSEFWFAARYGSAKAMLQDQATWFARAAEGLRFRTGCLPASGDLEYVEAYDPDRHAELPRLDLIYWELFEHSKPGVSRLLRLGSHEPPTR